MMNLRITLFKLQELYKKNKISNEYSEIEKHFNFKFRSNKDLEILLNHAKISTKFYQEVNSLNLDDYPVINKTLIKSRSEDFRSEKHLNEKLIEMTTSGSTGTPFTVFQDQRKKYRNYADTLFFARRAGFEIGDRVYYMKIWAKQKMAPNWKYFLQNIIPIDVLNLNNNKIGQIAKQIESESKNYSILGYVSALEHFIRYFDSQSLNSFTQNAKSVITMSESLGLESKNRLSEIFKCPVVSRYSNLENGIIAQQEIDGKPRFLVNSASYLVEIFDLVNDVKLKDGELGRIILTDLFNFAMPMIRYDTGDIGSIEREDGLVFLSQVEGRKLDLLFNTKSELVSSYIVYRNMWQYKEINQYQLLQLTQKSYVFKINCDIKFIHEEKLKSEFLEFLGSDADFKVEYVNEIPLLNSGKRKKIVNLYK
jgi:phenylacetate-CoA ligase